MSRQTNTQQDLLRELKSRLGGRLSHRTAYDGNVCLTLSSPDKPWPIAVVKGSPFTDELRITYKNRRVIIVTNEMDCRIEVRGELATRILTINREEKAGGFRSKHVGSRKIGDRKYPVYSENGEISLTQESVLKAPGLALLLNNLKLGEDESLHFNNAGVDIYLRAPSVERCTAAIQLVIDLINDIEITPEQLRWQNLPKEFRPLVPLIKKWALDDDGDREDLLESSPLAALSDLVTLVEPYLARIDSYLDSFPKRTPNEVGTALGRLAECVVEARQRLAKWA